MSDNIIDLQLRAPVSADVCRIVGEIERLPAKMRAALIVRACAADENDDCLCAIARFAAYMLGPKVLAEVQAGLLDALDEAES